MNRAAPSSHRSHPLVLDPSWPAAAPVRTDSDAQRFRVQLGLPPNRRLVLSGHQSMIWHGGILAKYAVLCAARDAEQDQGTHTAWLVVDHDEHPQLPIRYPALHNDRLVESRWPSDAGPEHGATGQRPPVPSLALDAPPPLPAATDSVATGLERIARALRAHADAPSASDQLVRAVGDLVRSWTEPLPVFSGTDVMRTDAFAQWVSRMRKDPSGCRDAYNRAAAEHPEARVRPLEPGELPLWTLIPGATRRPVFEHDVADIPPGALAPRALVNTGLVRTFGADVWVEGIGGRVYGRVTDRWLHDWLGITPHAIDVLATADLTAEGLSTHVPEPSSAARAAALAHRARHDPDLLGDEQGARDKRAALDRIRAADNSRERAAAFREMHVGLARSRTEHAGMLNDLRDRAERARLNESGRELAQDRTWAFPLLDGRCVAALFEDARRRIEP